MAKSKDTGVYHLSNSETGERYIGSGVLQTRRIQHFSDLRNNRHCNSLLQAAYNRNPNFEFKIIARCDKETALNLEQIALTETQGDPESLNMCKVSRGQSYEMNDEEIEKCRLRMLGNTYRLGAVLSTEHRAKVATNFQNLSVERSKPVNVDGQRFNSLNHAARELNISKTTVLNRIESSKEKFAHWTFDTP